MSHTPISRNYDALEDLLAKHEGKPAAVAEMLETAVFFIQTQMSLSCDAELQQAVAADLIGLRDCFEAL